MNILEEHTQALVAQRIEVKYIISEMLAQQIVDYITTYMDPDPHGGEYPVTSLYLDNHTMQMYWSSCTGEMNRYKLRIRSYTDNESPQLFAEVKRRLNRVILKSRVAICNDSIDGLLNGIGASEDMLMNPDDERGLADLNFFRSLMSSFQARPCTTVRYQREAYTGRNGESIRITFDRNLACLPSTEYSHDLWDAKAFWHTLHQIPVVLEVKFTDHYPYWVQHMIQRFNLERTSMAKYVECVRTLQRERISVIPKNEGVLI